MKPTMYTVLTPTHTPRYDDPEDPFPGLRIKIDIMSVFQNTLNQYLSISLDFSLM